MGTIDCPETSVLNYQHRLRNTPEERRSYLLPGGSLKTHVRRELPRRYEFWVLVLLTSNFLVVSFILNKILIFIFLNNFNPLRSWSAIFLFLISVCLILDFICLFKLDYYICITRRFLVVLIIV